ncbi:unnamed protein product, partial [Prorocentrum cordatum]
GTEGGARRRRERRGLRRGRRAPCRRRGARGARGDTGWRQAQQLGGVVHHAEGEAAGHAVEKASERVAFAAGFLCCASEVAAERIWAARLPLARAVAGQGATVSAAVPRI